MRQIIKAWTMSFQNSYVEVLTLNVTAFGDMTFMQESQVKQGCKGGALIQ